MKGKTKAKGKGLKKFWKWVIGIGAALVVLVTAGLCVKVSRMDKTGEVSARYGYEQGLIAADGTEVKGTTSIRTKDFITTDGLKITIDENPSISYVIYFYDADETFISSSDELATDFDAEKDTVPEGAAYIRIMITPENDPEVSTGEISDYAGELTVEYTKK